MSRTDQSPRHPPSEQPNHPQHAPPYHRIAPQDHPQFLFPPRPLAPLHPARIIVRNVVLFFPDVGFLGECKVRVCGEDVVPDIDPEEVDGDVS